MSGSAEKRLARLRALLQESEMLWQHGDLAGAQARCRAALRVDAACLPALYLLGVLLMAGGEPAEAAKYLSRVVGADRANPEARFNLGMALKATGRWEEALEHLRHAAAARPDDAGALINLAICQQALGRHAEAIETLERVRAPEDAVAEARNHMAHSLGELGRYREAAAACERAIKAAPNYAAAHTGLGYALSVLGRQREALASYRRGAELPADALSPGTALLATSEYLIALNYSTEVDGATLASEHRRLGGRFAIDRVAPAAARTRPAGRLRIGYLSPDLRGHPVAQFAEPLLEHHDRSAFEVFCYYTFGREDGVSQRLRRTVPHWLHCASLSDAQLVERIRADRIDVLVELSGHTALNRLAALSSRPAPVQVSYLGYPSTTGVAALDYRISDARADPPGEGDRLSTERVLRPRPTYFCFRPDPASPDPGPPPCATNGFVTFGCFNNLLKLSDAFLAAAARVLSEVPRSRLVLKARLLAHGELAAALRERLEKAGVEPSRVEVYGWDRGTSGHLADYRAIDIALDSFPYNGATTTCEALWMGVPVVTLEGDRHAGRMGSSILHALGLGDLVTTSTDAYVRKCSELAASNDLADLRRTLRERMRASPLTDGKGLAAAFERCYREIAEAAVTSR